MSPDKLVYMANQIGTFFRSQGLSARRSSIAEHISKFWDPRMRRAILDHVAQHENATGLEPPVLQAIKSLKPPVN